MARITLDLSDGLLAELKRRADKRGVCVANLIRQTLERRFSLTSGRPKGDISDRPEMRRATKVQDETRGKLEGSGYSGSEVIWKMLGGGW